MLAHDVIELAVSPWCSNVVMVKKCDDTMCFCIDYHKANDLIKKDKFPLPEIDTCPDTLNGCRYFSSCTCTRATGRLSLTRETVTRLLSLLAKVNGILRC